MAREAPIRRGRRTVPRSISGTPKRRQKTPNTAPSAATLRSHQQATSSPPATAWPSTAFSPERLARIDRFLAEKYVNPGRMPGVQFLLARNGELVHQTVLGNRDVERGTKLTDDTVFRIYSMTKPVTSVALMSLVEE